MQYLHTEADLAKMCAEVFEQAGLTKSQVSEAMGVSNPAVYYMINAPDKSMSKLRKRFLREVAGMTVEGPAYYVDGDGTVTVDEAQTVLPGTADEIQALIDEGRVEVNDNDKIIYASLYAALLTDEAAEDDAEG
jgi:hypothetical protein